MELRLVILSVACFSCLIPSALSINLLAAKAVASQAAENIVSIGANTIATKKAAVAQAATDIASIAAQGVVLKGKALKTAATSVAGAVINGAVSIGATIAKAGLNMLAAKFGAKPTLVYEPSNILVQKPVLRDAVVRETIVPEPFVMEYDQALQVPIQIPPINAVSVDVRPQFWDIPAPPQLTESVWTTVNEPAPAFEIVGPANSPYTYDIVQSPQAAFEVVGPANSPYVYDYVQTPQVFGPLMDTFRFVKK